MTGYVGDAPTRYYGAVIVAVAAPYVELSITDDLDADGATSTVTATGVGAVNDKVTVAVLPTGRAILVKS